MNVSMLRDVLCIQMLLRRPRAIFSARLRVGHLWTDLNGRTPVSFREIMESARSWVYTKGMQWATQRGCRCSLWLLTSFDSFCSDQGCTKACPLPPHKSAAWDCLASPCASPAARPACAWAAPPPAPPSGKGRCSPTSAAGDRIAPSPSTPRLLAAGVDDNEIPASSTCNSG